jgi:hypothetical protein
MLGAMSEVGLVVRLHKLGLLPEANRKTFVKTITEYAVEGQDLTAMSSKSSAACSRMRNLRNGLTSPPPHEPRVRAAARHPQPKGFRAGLEHHAGRSAVGQPSTQLSSRTTRLLRDRTCAIAHTHLALSAAQVDADVVHGRSPFGPQYRDLKRARPLHPFWSSPDEREWKCLAARAPPRRGQPADLRWEDGPLAVDATC